MSALPQSPRRVYEFGELPFKYVRHLTAGPGGSQEAIPLDAEAAELLIAVDLGNLNAALLVVEEPGQVAAIALHGAQRMVKAKLRERSYTITHELLVSAKGLSDVRRNPGRVTQALGQGEPIAQFRRWVSQGIKQGASDIHVQFDDNEAEVRVRIDGTLMPLDDGAQGVYGRAAAIDAVAAGYNTTTLGNSRSDYDAERFVDCIIKHTEGTECDLRFQNLPGRFGPKVVIRIQRDSDRSTQGDFKSAGYTPSQQRLWVKAARRKGTVLITGSVNSGKSTSLQTFIETRPDRVAEAEYTVEDPVERKIKGAHQIELLRDPANPAVTNERYAEAIRGLLRGDTDLVGVGEIRDFLTANFWLQIGLSGHVALGTLHTNFLSSIAGRLEKMGLSRLELTVPNVVNLLVYQALLPQLCGRCRTPASDLAKSDAEMGDTLALLRSKFDLDPARFFVRGPGCEHCRNRGTRGRVVVAEMFMPDRQWLAATRAGDDHAAELHYRSLSDGLLTSDDMTGKTVFEHALLRAWNGEIDVRACEEFEGFDRYEVMKKGGSK